MLITEKYPEYKKDGKLGIYLKRMQLFAVLLFILTLCVGMLVLIITKNPYHFIWIIAAFVVSILFFDISRRITQPRCYQCGLKTKNETFDISPSDLFFKRNVESVVYKGRLYTRLRLQNKASKADATRIITQDYFICHTCKIYSPRLIKNEENSSKNFDALKRLASDKKKKKTKHRTTKSKLKTCQKSLGTRL